MFEDTLSYLMILTEKPESWVSFWRGTSHRAAEKQFLSGTADVVVWIKVTPDQGPSALDICLVSQSHTHATSGSLTMCKPFISPVSHKKKDPNKSKHGLTNQTHQRGFTKVLLQIVIAFSPKNTSSKLYLFFILRCAQTAAEPGS